jgi:Yip1 domain
MSDIQFPAVPAVSEGPALTQAQRVIYTFTAPSKTFTDIKRSTSWWMPFLIGVVATYILFFAVKTKVGFEQVAENQIRMSPKRAEQFEKLPPEQRASQMKISVIITEVIFAVFPIFSLITIAILAGVLMATINFGFGGKATFWEVFAVSWYAHLPSLIKVLLGVIALFAGLAPESFDSQNFAGTNPGYYLSPETSKPLLALATSLDVTTIWTLVLTAIGLSIVSKTKRSSAYIAVFGWWILVVLISVGAAAAFS